METLNQLVSIEDTGCWRWLGKPMKGGYGRKAHAGITQKAHRAVWVLFHGPVPDDLKVLHTCDNPICVNPEHLFVGTTQDNWDDCRSKGRHCYGERVNKAKLTESAVREIRSLYQYRSHDANLAALAGRFNVSIATVAHAVKGHTWGHVQ